MIYNIISIIGLILYCIGQGLTEGASWNFIQNTKTRIIPNMYMYHTIRTLFEMTGFYMMIFGMSHSFAKTILCGFVYLFVYRLAFVFERGQSIKEIGRTNPYEIWIFGKVRYIPYPSYIVIICNGIASLIVLSIIK